MSDLIERQAAIEDVKSWEAVDGREEHLQKDVIEWLKEFPSAQPEPHEIGYDDCANVLLKMWMDNVLTDGEYNRIMDKLNAHWAERREE